eukprot:1780339-Alexandrium_andersonii.AAC.1
MMHDVCVQWVPLGSDRLVVGEGRILAIDYLDICVQLAELATLDESATRDQHLCLPIAMKLLQLAPGVLLLHGLFGVCLADLLLECHDALFPVGLA